MEEKMDDRNLTHESKGNGNETPEIETKTTFLREVSAMYRGGRRATRKIYNATDAAHFIRSVLPDNSREHFVALYLDGAHKVVAFSVISTGSATSCPVHPREIFQSAILVGAVAIIVGHNHPSGETSPSNEDKQVTKRLKEAGEILAIRILDHVILGETGIHSFSEHDGV